MRLLAGVLAVSLVVPSAGCSFVFVDGPPKHHRELPAFDCSTSRVVPVLDTAFAGFELVNFALAAAMSDQDWTDVYKKSAPFSRHTGMAVYAVLAAAAGAGAYVGWTRVGACRDAKQELAERTRLHPPAPGSWLPPAPPAPTPPTPAPTPTPTPDPEPPPPLPPAPADPGAPAPPSP